MSFMNSKSLVLNCFVQNHKYFDKFAHTHIFFFFFFFFGGGGGGGMILP